MGADSPAKPLSDVGVRAQCAATAEAGGLQIRLEFGRLKPGSDGSPASAAADQGTKTEVTSLCPTTPPPATTGGHMWSCAGPENEITPVAGATEGGDFAIVILVGSRVPTPAVHDKMAATTTQLARDLLTKLSLS
jgi:hypothetical protein